MNPPQIKSAAVKNNPQTGLMDIELGSDSGSINLSIPSYGAVALVNLLMLRLLELRDDEVMADLQTFAIKEIQAGRTPDGHLYLKYRMENGLGFGTGLPREQLMALHQQLSDILSLPACESGGSKYH